MSAIVAAHVLLAAIYSVTVPLWEAHDEWAHYKYVEYVARHRSLPPLGQRLTQEYAYDQADQPPLYYSVAALPVLFAVPSDGFTLEVNPYATTGTGTAGVNFAVHDPAIERFPYRGTVLAAHLARWMSVLLGILALVATYRLGRLVLPFARLPDEAGRQISIGALAIAAFSPQFLFISSVITNDVLVVGLGCCVSLLCLRVALPGSRLRHVLILSGLVALALLTKYTALALVPAAIVAAAISLGRRRRGGASVPAHSTQPTGPRVWAVAGAALLVLVGTAGWWFWRNVALSGQLLPRDPWAVYWFLTYLRRPLDALSNLRWSAVPAMLGYGFKTFWASFGWGNVGAPQWVYLLLAAIVALAALGLARAFFRRDRLPGARLAMLLLLLQIAMVVALPLAREMMHQASYLRGRYLLPALASVSVLISWGLSQLPSPLSGISLHGRSIPSVAIVGMGMLALDVALLWWLIAPAYRPPDLLAEATLGPTETPLHARFADKAELVGYEVWPKEVRPGEGIAVTLLWKALQRFDRNYTVGVHLLGEGQSKYGQTNLYPGRGNFATTLWKPGDTFRETYWVELRPPDGAIMPTGGRVSVALFIDDADQEHLPATDPQGQSLGEAVIFGRFKIAPEAAAMTGPADVIGACPGAVTEGSRTSAPLGRFDNAIELARVDFARTAPVMPGNTFPVTVTWCTVSTPSSDFTSFLHLVSPDGEQVAGVDAPPRAGNYPTGLWGPGDVMEQRFLLTLPRKLPAGPYRLALGMYRPDTMERAPTTDAAGRPAPDNALQIGALDLLPRGNERWIPLVESSPGAQSPSGQ